MSTLTHDAPHVRADVPTPRSTSGLLIALASAVAFGVGGPLAKPLLDAGWSPGAAVLGRVALGALLLLPLGLRALRGRWWLLRRHAGLIGLYGLLGVVVAQFCYFSAVSHMQVGPALMIEYTAPVVIVGWLWLRHGQRPTSLTLAGGVACALGLLLVLDVLTGAELSLAGVAWATAAMVGLVGYFLISGDDSTDLPPLALAAGGLVVGGVVLGGLGVVGLLPLRATTASVTYAGLDVAWWVPLLLLGLVSAAVAYVTGIAAARRLGSRLASFVALGEVVAGVLAAWLLLGELPRPVQLLGGLLVLAGVVVVKLGEPRVAPAAPEEAWVG